MIRVVPLIVVVLIIMWFAAAKADLSNRTTRATKADVDRARKDEQRPPDQ